MHKSLRLKLIFAFMLVAFTSVGLVALMIRLTSAYQLEQMVEDQDRNNLMQALRIYYLQNQSWQRLAADWEQIHSQADQSGPDFDEAPITSGNSQGEISAEGDQFGMVDGRGVVIVPVDPKYPPGSQLPPNLITSGTPLFVAGAQVATILDSNRPPSLDPEETLYLQRTYWALAIAILGALLVSFLVGARLARTLTSPLDALKRAAHAIAHGQLEQQVMVEGEDELGQLARAFNRMSQEVARVNQSRRQMTADIAHELGTPLTVISGYIEGMEDGSVKPTRERFRLIRAEIDHLQSLVGDLRMLSLADAGELALHLGLLSPQELLAQAAQRFQPSATQRKVTLSVEVYEALPPILVDRDRMLQILGNLVANSLRYTPPDGQITLAARKVGDQIEISVWDTGAGIDPQELPYIFDRFRRAEKSRHTESGQSGLGLAIVKVLVELHGGRVTAKSTLGAGTVVYFTIPCQGSMQAARKTIA